MAKFLVILIYVLIVLAQGLHYKVQECTLLGDSCEKYILVEN